MKRLLKSSLFWNAVVGSMFAVGAYEFTDSELIATGVFSLFGVRSFATGASDFVKANKGIRYDEEKGHEVLIDN